MTGLKLNKRQWLALALAGLLPNVAAAQVGSGVLGRNAAATQASRTQAQVQQRTQAQIQQRVQAQAQQRVQAQAQQRVQTQIQERARGRVSGTARRAAGIVQGGAANARLDANLRVDTRVQGSSAAAADSPRIARAGMQGRGNAQVDAAASVQLSATEMQYYDDVFGRFNPFRAPAAQPAPEAPAPSDSPQPPADRSQERGAGLALSSTTDLNARIGHALRMRQSEVSQLRDRALETGDASLLARADQMEAKLRGFANAQARATAEAQANAAMNSALHREGTAVHAALNASPTAVANAAAGSAVGRAAAAQATAEAAAQATAEAAAQAAAQSAAQTNAGLTAGVAAEGSGQLSSGSSPAPTATAPTSTSAPRSQP
ncbi:hypothetical protein [Candidatus Laterigemmans baculatus]|uniref:hypothetical protein n=1 Tax=Candidatus Laterigemmans baculatus TaxID=2770505 RepID=UPI0013DBA028|nr:hypothetical protein [Candidatus Laterigemmans baculatus]